MTERETVVLLSASCQTQRKHFSRLSGLQFVTLKFSKFYLEQFFSVKCKIERSMILSAIKQKINKIRWDKDVQNYTELSFS